MEKDQTRTAIFELQAQLRDPAVSDQEILARVQAAPQLLDEPLPSGANLFVGAVMWGRLTVAQGLAALGADVNWKCRASRIAGNALNVACTPQQADALLELGVKIERDLAWAGDFHNPALAAVEHNDPLMLRYWIEKQAERFAADDGFLTALYAAVADRAAALGQAETLGCVIGDERLYCALQTVCAQKSDPRSVKLLLGALRRVKGDGLEAKKRELRRILREGQKGAEPLP